MRRCCAARRTTRTRRRSALCSRRRIRSISRQLGIGVLKQRRPLDEHVDADPVADRHLVDEAAEVPLHLRDARLERVAPALEVDDLTLRRRRRAWRDRRGGGAAYESPTVDGRLRGLFDSGHSHAPDSPLTGPKKFPVNLPPWHPACCCYRSADGGVGGGEVVRVAEDLAGGLAWPSSGPPPRAAAVAAAAFAASPFKPFGVLRLRRRGRGRRGRGSPPPPPPPCTVMTCGAAAAARVRGGLVARAADQDAEPDRQQQHADAGDQRGAGADTAAARGGATRPDAARGAPRPPAGPTGNLDCPRRSPHSTQ